MKRIFSALAAALCMMLSAEAQDTDAHIHGHVIDKATGEHLLNTYPINMIKNVLFIQQPRSHHEAVG